VYGYSQEVELTIPNEDVPSAQKLQKRKASTTNVMAGGSSSIHGEGSSNLGL